jgi:hypothetical protein
MTGGRERSAVLAIARTELRAKLRRIRGDTRKLLATVLSLGFFGVVATVVGLGPVVAFGRALAASPPPVGRFGFVVGGLVGVGLYLGGASALNRSDIGRVGPLVRSSTTPRAVVVGRACGELLHGSLYLVVLVPLVVELAVGARGVLAPLVAIVGLVPVGVGATLAGRALGGVADGVSRRLGVTGWTRIGLGVVAVGVVFVASQSLTESLISDSGTGLPTTAVLPGAPLQAYASVVLAPLGATVDPLGIAVAGAIGVVTVGSAAVMLAVERRQLIDGGESTAGTVESSGRVPAPFTRYPATRIGWRYLVRTRRNPATLSHLFPVFIGLLSFSSAAIADPSLVLTAGPGALIVIGVVLAGATYGLNPLGDERDQLTLLLTSARSTAVCLRGRTVAGCVVGVAFLALAVPLDLYSNGVAGSLARAAVGLLLVPVAAGTALGLGAALPTFEEREYMNVERPHPSLLLLFTYLIGGLFVTAGGLGLATWTVVAGPSLVAGVLWLVYLPLVVVPAAAGYVSAVRRFDGLELDDV